MAILSGKLNPQEIDEYFEKHLPYRLGALLAHYRMTHDAAGNDLEWRGDPGQLTACFIASLVTGRLFLNVMGVGKKAGKLSRYVWNPKSDVNAEDLGGKLIDLSTLGADETLFFNFIVMADRAAAHFTKPEAHDWQKTHNVILRIQHYVKVNLYDAAGR